MAYEPQLHIVLYNPEIPQNTGAIGRTCVALQAKLWLVRPLGFRVDDRTLKRAGLDYWQHLEWEVADHREDLCGKLATDDCWFFSRFATKDFRTPSYRAGNVLVFGCETSGLPLSLTKDRKEQLLRIPTSEDVRSLNLSSAVAVAGYEWQRNCQM